MKKLLIASACVMSLSTAAFAQYQQPSPGASSEGNVGPGARTMAPRDSGMTTGSSVTAPGTTRAGRMAPSSEGNVGPGTNNNRGPQPGGR